MAIPLVGTSHIFVRYFAILQKDMTNNIMCRGVGWGGAGGADAPTRTSRSSAQNKTKTFQKTGKKAQQDYRANPCRRPHPTL